MTPSSPKNVSSSARPVVLSSNWGLTSPSSRTSPCKPPRRIYRLGDQEIFYETSGDGESLLLLHGGFGTVEDFSSQIPELAKHFRVVAFERPGHGHTADNSEPFRFVTMSEYTVDFIEALGLGATNLVGWAMGQSSLCLSPFLDQICSSALFV